MVYTLGHTALSKGQKRLLFSWTNLSCKIPTDQTDSRYTNFFPVVQQLLVSIINYGHILYNTVQSVPYSETVTLPGWGSWKEGPPWTFFPFQSFLFQIQFLVVIPVPCIKSNTGLAPIIKIQNISGSNKMRVYLSLLTIWAWIVPGYYDIFTGCKADSCPCCSAILSLNIHLPFHDLGAIPALLSPQLESSQWKEGSGEKRRPYSFLLGTWPAVARVDFCLHPIGQNLVTWFRHTREVGKWVLILGTHLVQLKLRTLY